MEEHNEELIRIKECYVQLGEDSRGLEQKLREEFEKEKQMLLSEVTSTPWEPGFFIPSGSLQTSLKVEPHYNIPYRENPLKGLSGSSG